jgi:two-component system CheB/CheR fusion protein
VSKNNGQRDLRVVWHEAGATSPAKSPPPGLGSDLIDHAIPGARVQRELRQDGLVCTIQLTLIDAEH